MNNFFAKGQNNFDIDTKKAKALGYTKSFCIDFVIALAVVVLLLQFVQPNRVYQESMVPTYNDRDMVLVNKVAYYNSTPERGDIIVFDSDDEGDRRYIKRVIGISGDHIEIHDGNVFVNNVRQNQSYTCDGVTDGDVNLVVPDDSCFVLGDNREVSIDSRSDSLGCVPYEKIIGKVMFAKRVVLDEEVN